MYSLEQVNLKIIHIKENLTFQQIQLKKYAAKQLVRQLYKGEPIRLIGIRVDNLCEEDEKQISIFENNDTKKQEKLDKVVDLIKDKYGYETITRAGDMKHTKNINRKD